jgi:hypothetical protein
MSYGLELFSSERIKVTAHVTLNELYQTLWLTVMLGSYLPDELAILTEIYHGFPKSLQVNA